MQPALEMVASKRTKQRRVSPLRVSLALGALVGALASAPALAAVSPPRYSAGVTVVPDFYLDDGQPLSAGYPPFGDSPAVSLDPVDVGLIHNSALHSVTTGSASSGPANGGTLNTTVSTVDEQVGAQASLVYTFQLRPKEGVVVPDVVPLHVLASGSTAAVGYGTARIWLALNWIAGPMLPGSIVQSGSTEGIPGVGVTHSEGDGTISVNEDISVLLNRDFTVQMLAVTSAGIPAADLPGQDNSGTALAFLDPQFTLPDAFRDLVDIVGVPSGSVVSPPTGSSAVPEPSSWIIMIAGFGVVGCAMRRRARFAETRLV